MAERAGSAGAAALNQLSGTLALRCDRAHPLDSSIGRPRPAARSRGPAALPSSHRVKCPTLPRARLKCAPDASEASYQTRQVPRTLVQAPGTPKPALTAMRRPSALLLVTVACACAALAHARHLLASCCCFYGVYCFIDGLLEGPACHPEPHGSPPLALPSPQECAQDGSLCDSNQQCCSGFCVYHTAHPGEPPRLECGPGPVIPHPDTSGRGRRRRLAGADAMPHGGRPACKQLNEWCFRNIDCCSGVCVGHLHGSVCGQLN